MEDSDKKLFVSAGEAILAATEILTDHERRLVDLQRQIDNLYKVVEELELKKKMGPIQ